jgi:hypothetical protein
VRGPAAYRDHKKRADDCVAKKGQVTFHASSDNFDQAEDALDDARRLCGDDATAEIDALVRELAVKRKAAADKARGRTEARERAAVDAFPQRTANLRQMLRDATEAVARNDAKQAALFVLTVWTALDMYRGTSVVKSEQWRELSDQTETLQKKVQPFLDAQKASRDAAQKQIAEQAEQDRRDGVKVTKPGYIAAATLEKLQRAAKYAAANDKEGFALLVEEDPDIMMLPPNLAVSVFERGGFAGGYVHVRVLGTLTEFWTMSEALRDE